MLNQGQGQIISQLRVKPAIHKKNVSISIPKTVRVAVQQKLTPQKPSRQSAKLPAIPPVIKPSLPVKNKIADSRRIPEQPLRQAIAYRQEKRRLKKTGVKYTTKQATPESAIKIKELRNKGRGRILVIIGNGPSLLETAIGELKNIPGVDTLSINRPDPRIWPTTYWAFFDRNQLKRNQELWNSYEGIIFNSTAIREQKNKSMQFTNQHGIGFSRDLVANINIGFSSVYASLQIAMWMDYSRIYIFGCDMNPEGLDGKMHYYGVNPDVNPKIRGERFERESRSYQFAATNLNNVEREKIVFCTEYNPWDFIKAFSHMSHKIAVDDIRLRANAML